MAKTIGEMRLEIRDLHGAKGWGTKGGDWEDQIALIHTEVSEIMEAYRIRGIEGYTSAEGKPDDVASELADVMIRTIGVADRFDIPISDDVQLDLMLLALKPKGLEDMTIGKAVCWLHQLITRAWTSQSSADLMQVVRAVVTVACTPELMLDMNEQYERKMAWNWSRPYKHGGKRL